MRILFLNKKGLIGDLYVQAYRGEERKDENCNATLIDEEFFRIGKWRVVENHFRHLRNLLLEF